LPPTRRTVLQQLSALGLLAPAAYAQSMAQTMIQGYEVAAPKPTPMSMTSAAPLAVPIFHASNLASFVDPLPLPERARPVAAAHPRKFRIAMREIHAKVHRDLPPTRQWSYGETALAPLIDVHTHQPLEIEWVNNLPAEHFLPIDHSLHGCGRDIPDVRACVHLHGGRTPAKDDGQPDEWFVPGKSRICTYPLQQEATALWYHDHAMGLNRLNMYAGLFGMVLLRSPEEDALHLPSGKYEVPLVIYDRLFTTDGQLLYPDSGDPEHAWIPEFAGDAILLNGKIRPYFEVEPRLYRFRVVNAANSSFFSLSLTGSQPGNQPFRQIGTDQGLLATPVELRSLLLAPAERADLLIDFSRAAGQRLHLRNSLSEILEFRVASQTSALATAVPATLRSIQRTPESAAVTTRPIMLNEYKDKIGNSMIMLLNRKRWHEPVTETPRINTTEIWEFINLTEDTHPMHLHLVRFQLLDRRVFDVFAYENGRQVKFRGPVLSPEPNELGWKDVIQCPPGIITRIIVTFDGYPGDYLYHCHILEHEANDMMRPFRVLA